ncbi:dUTP diphosphatase, partial [Rhodococcus sp. NPDC060086]|uniref:dUTP diphosphatase n=1 Tax=Rhodococcus sp. NPDC060086 TaxID=3347055 RepID=UPI00365EFCD7
MPLRRLDPGVPMPTRAHAGDAGVDLCSTSNVTIEPGQRVLVGTGISVALPVGTVGLIHPRSGLAAKFGLSVVNTPGTVDAGYRGEIKVCLINHDTAQAVEVNRGDRIAQLLVQRGGGGGVGGGGGPGGVGEAPDVCGRPEGCGVAVARGACG